MKYSRRCVCALGIGLVVMFLFTGCTRFFFFPMRDLIRTPTEIGLKFEDVHFAADDGVRLHGWWLPAEGVAQGTIIYFHGNAENISTHIGSVYWLPAAGYNVFMPDYRGYGWSQGEVSLPGIHADGAAAMRAVFERADVDRSRIIVLGQSLGGAVAIYTVAHSPYRNQIKALIADSAFASHRQIAREKLGASWLTWLTQWPFALTVSDEYSPLKSIADLSPVPLLLVHGMADTIIPVSHAQQLFAAAQEPKTLWEVPDAGHIQALSMLEYRQRLVAFMTAALRNSTDSRRPATD